MLSTLAQFGLTILGQRRPTVLKGTLGISLVSLVCAVAACFALSTDSPSILRNVAWRVASAHDQGVDVALFAGVQSLVREVEFKNGARKAFGGSMPMQVTTKAMQYEDVDCPDQDFCQACADSSSATATSALGGVALSALSMAAQYWRTTGRDTDDKKWACVVTGLGAVCSLLFAVCNFLTNCNGTNLDSFNSQPMMFLSALGPGLHLMIFSILTKLVTIAVHILTPVLCALGLHGMAERLNREVDALPVPGRPARKFAPVLQARTVYERPALRSHRPHHAGYVGMRHGAMAFHVRRPVRPFRLMSSLDGAAQDVYDAASKFGPETEAYARKWVRKILDGQNPAEQMYILDECLLEDSEICMQLEDSIKKLWIALSDADVDQGQLKSPVLQSWVGMNS